MSEEETSSLAALEKGDRGVFVRVSDSDPEMLRYLSGNGITPGKRFEVVERMPFDGPAARPHRQQGAHTRRPPRPRDARRRRPALDSARQPAVDQQVDAADVGRPL